MQHHGKPITKQKQTFSLLSDIDVEKTCFVTVKLNLLIIVLVFLSFINTFLEPAVSRCSSKQVLLKFCPVNIARFLKEQLYYRSPQLATSVFF